MRGEDGGRKWTRQSEGVPASPFLRCRRSPARPPLTRQRFPVDHASGIYESDATVPVIDPGAVLSGAAKRVAFNNQRQPDRPLGLIACPHAGGCSVPGRQGWGSGTTAEAAPGQSKVAARPDGGHGVQLAATYYPGTKGKETVPVGPLSTAKGKTGTISTAWHWC